MANKGGGCPFRPTDEDLAAIEKDVAGIGDIQQTLLARHDGLRFPDRVAHQYQVAGSPVRFSVARGLPPELQGVGLFEPGSEHSGIGRLSTGLGTPHIETNPDFLGIMLAFRTGRGERVDFLGINDPAAPTDDHGEFMDVLHATAAAAGEEIFLGDWGEYDLGNLLAEQKAFAGELKDRMGWLKAGKTLAHIVRQTFRTFRSSTACQRYWTGIVETGGVPGKFSLVPVRDDNRIPEFRPGEDHLSREWQLKQAAGDIEFTLYWIPFLSEEETPTAELTQRWEEGHRQAVGTVVFPVLDSSTREGRLWATLAMEMGANPGNWVRDAGNTIEQPGTRFTAARKIAYRLSQRGRDVLGESWYEDVFRTGRIGDELARELDRRREEKDRAGHVNRAGFRPGP